MGIIKNRNKNKNVEEYSANEYIGYDVFYVSSNYHNVYDIFNNIIKKDKKDIIKCLSTMTMCIQNIGELKLDTIKYITNLSQLRIYYEDGNGDLIKDSLYVTGSLYDWLNYLQELTQIGYDRELPTIIQNLYNTSAKYLDRIVNFKFSENTTSMYLETVALAHNIHLSLIDKFIFEIVTENDELIDILIKLSDKYYGSNDKYVFSFDVIVFYEVYFAIASFYANDYNREKLEAIFSNLKEFIDSSDGVKLYNNDNNKDNDSYYENIDEVIE